MNIRATYEKYKNIIPYFFFGVCTTLVNVTVYWIMVYGCGGAVMLSTITAWIAAVSFAYITNRKWVFHSEKKTVYGIIKEGISFFVCRATTGVFDLVCMFVLVEMLCFNDLIVKTGVNFLVIGLNYIASRLIIFNH